MMRSKNIQDYFEAFLSQIKPGLELPCDIHLYFRRNNHLILWVKKGDIPTEEFVSRYGELGLKSVWIHNDDRKVFEEYWANRIVDLEAPASPSDSTSPDANRPKGTANHDEPTAPARRSEEAAFMAAVMASPTVTAEQKEAVLAEAAQAVLRQAAQAETPAEQVRATAKARQTVQDFLDFSASEAQSRIADIWKLANADQDLEHAANVATYAVIFAMAFGRVDQNLISDLAMAGLLHDIGLSQLSPKVVSLPNKTMAPDQSGVYATHIQFTLELIESYAADIPERVKTIIRQHHEKFDGTGYPQGLSGFKFDDVAQLVALSDMLDSIGSGRWDGTQRTLRDSFQTLERLEKAKTFPEYFNPEVFSAVLRWTKSNVTQESIASVSQVVGDRAKNLLESA